MPQQTHTWFLLGAAHQGKQGRMPRDGLGSDLATLAVERTILLVRVSKLDSAGANVIYSQRTTGNVRRSQPGSSLLISLFCHSRNTLLEGTKPQAEKAAVLEQETGPIRTMRYQGSCHLQGIGNIPTVQRAWGRGCHIGQDLRTMQLSPHELIAEEMPSNIAGYHDDNQYRFGAKGEGIVKAQYSAPRPPPQQLRPTGRLGTHPW